jgi:Ca-activated chloride channel family protein
VTFAYPYVFLIPAAAAVLAVFYKRAAAPRAAVAYPDLSHLRALPPSLRMRLRTPTLGTLTVLAVALSAVAAARPQLIGAPLENAERRNIMLAVDVSRSMETPDFGTGFRSLRRIDGVKEVISQFIRERQNDRLGLVVFGTNAFLQAPLTMDHDLVAQLADQLDVGIAGDGTAIGDGLGLSLKRLQSIEGESKAIILLTDGVSNSGQVNPLKAAHIAREFGIKVHTIGIGSSETASGRGGIFSLRPVREAEFDEKTLKEIAETTGGVYFNAAGIEGLQNVYHEIDRLEQSSAEEQLSRRVEELYFPFAAAALAAYALALILARTVFLKVP